MIRTTRLALILTLALAATTPADAGWFRHRRRACQPARYAAPASYPPRAHYAAPAPTMAPTGQADVATPRALASPSSPSPGPAWLAWLNSNRAARGLRPLAHDPALDADATWNSAIGFGHFTHGWRRGQVAGWGALGAVEMLWLASPAHHAILMDPYATSAGFGMVGPNSTIDTN